MCRSRKSLRVSGQACKVCLEIGCSPGSLGRDLIDSVLGRAGQAGRQRAAVAFVGLLLPCLLASFLTMGVLLCGGSCGTAQVLSAHRL